MGDSGSHKSCITSIYSRKETFSIFDNQFLHIIARGDLGVDLFFVISGYLIGSLLLTEYKKSQSIELKRFYVRRFLRLIPVYLVVMILGVYFLHGWNVGNAWANLIYVNNFLPMTQAIHAVVLVAGHRRAVLSDTAEFSCCWSCGYEADA